MLATTFVGSVTGGLLGERLFVPGLVHAQKPNGVYAEEFLLLRSIRKKRARASGWMPMGSGLGSDRPGRESNPGLVAGRAGGCKTHGPLRSGLVVGAVRGTAQRALRTLPLRRQRVQTRMRLVDPSTTARTR